MPSKVSIIESKLSIASGFSIFAITGKEKPSFLYIFKIGLMSLLSLTNDNANQSILFLAAKSKCCLSLFVKDLTFNSIPEINAFFIINYTIISCFNE